jgi:hypothetical protein
MFVRDKMKIFAGGKDYEAGETVKIEDMKIVKRYKSTPDNIKKLENYEVFVFGSNLAGNHSGGTAKLALDKFGAEEGNGEGLQGQSYAFPTLTKKMEKRTEKNLKKSVDKLIGCANDNTTKIFLVTKIGCGIAGYKEEEMKMLFDRNDVSANIVLPEGWRNDI